MGYSKAASISASRMRASVSHSSCFLRRAGSRRAEVARRSMSRRAPQVASESNSSRSQHRSEKKTVSLSRARAREDWLACLCRRRSASAVPQPLVGRDLADALDRLVEHTLFELFAREAHLLGGRLGSCLLLPTTSHRGPRNILLPARLSPALHHPN